MSNYTPTTDEVLRCYRLPLTSDQGQREGESFAEFLSRRSIETALQQVADREAAQRWLAEVERAAAEKALSKAADDLRVNFSRGAAIAMHHECHKKQCRCGNPGNDEIVRDVFEAAREAIRNEALAYRRNKGEK